MADIDLNDFYCRNNDCKFYNIRRSGNISIRARYGKNHDSVLLHCRCCNKTFSTTHGTAYFRSRTLTNVINLIVQLSADGFGLNATCRATCVSKTTAIRYIKNAANRVEAILAMQKNDFTPTEIQLDELWAYVGKKKAANAMEIEAGLGEKWIWTAIDVRTRMVLNTHIGGHELIDAYMMFNGLRNIKRYPHLFTSDELAHYKTVLVDLYHREVLVPRTGRRGRPRKPIIEIDPRLNYATVRNIRKKGHVIKTIRTIVFGTQESFYLCLDDSPSNTINTAYIERSNGTWRLNDAHLRRKTITFSKSFECIKAKFMLGIGFYNLIRPHSSLSAMEKVTPAMCAKVTDHIWSVTELLTARAC